MSEQARVVGPLGAASIVAGSMLGVGILLTPPVVAAATPHPLAFAAVWILGAATALSGAVAYAELGAMLPEAGGDVVFQGEAFGPSLAFASGSVAFALAFAGSIAALAVAIGTYQAQSLLTAAGATLDMSAGIGPISGAQLLGAGLVLLITAVNHRGARAAAGLQTVLTLVPLVGLAALAAWGLIAGAPPVDLPAPEGQGLAGFGRASAGVYFAFAGWPAVVYLAGEVRQPGRTLPLGMLGGTLLISALYGLLCAAFVAVLGMGGLADAGEAGSALARALLGPRAETLVAGLVLLALLASINGTVLGGARVALAMARRGALPRALAQVSPDTGTPVVALWVQAAIAVALALTGGFEAIMALSSLAMMLVGSISVLALYRLRQRRPDLARPYRATGYPLSPLLYLLVSLGTLGTSVWAAVTEGGAMLPLLGIGLLVALAVGHRLLARPVAARAEP